MLSISINFQLLFDMVQAVLPSILGPLLFAAGIGIAALLARMLRAKIVEAFRT